MALNIEAGLICLQEAFLENKNIAHNTFNFYWLRGVRADARVLTAIKKELGNQIIVENRTDLMDHLYLMALDIRDIDEQSNRPTKRTRAINIYDNQVGQRCTWVGHTSQNRRALEDIMWNRVIRGRVLLLRDMNAHNPLWNPHCQRRINAKPLEELIEKFHLLINNESGRSTRPISRGVSIIDLVLSTIELGPLSLWEISKDLLSLLDYELIVL